MRIAVFCGSSSGDRPLYTEGAKAMGRYLAEHKIGLVYGGGKVGLMGVVADAALAAGGEVIGVIPVSLSTKELAHPGLTELQVVADMHERKAAMAELSDAFIAMPGGAGTLEEIFEAWTWAQLGYHKKACAFYNLDGFFDPLFAMIDKMSASGFVKPMHAQMLIRETSPEALVEAIHHYQPPVHKWA